MFVDLPSGDLVAEFSPFPPPHRRLALQAEIEAHANGAAQVIAACEIIVRGMEPQAITADYARDWVHRWYAAGGTIRVGARGWLLVRGYNTAGMADEWPAVKRVLLALAAARTASVARRHTRPGARS